MKAALIFAAVCRWTGRILGTLLAMAIVCLAVGEGVPNVLRQPFRVQIGFVALGLLVAGIITGWMRELLGGVLIVAGWGVFMVVAVGAPSRWNLFITLLALPGILLIASAWLRRRRA
jgi:hypothetical protein